jgi:hypothetical protein
MTASRFRTVKAPHGTLVHFDYLNDGRTDETVRSTSCGRKVPGAWECTALPAATAVQQITCPRCLEWAQYHHVEELALAAGVHHTAATMAATDAANSPELYAAQLQLHTPAAAAAHMLATASPEAFGSAPSCGSGLLERGRVAIRRAEQLQRRAREAVALRTLPPAGTLRV